MIAETVIRRHTLSAMRAFAEKEPSAGAAIPAFPLVACPAGATDEEVFLFPAPVKSRAEITNPRRQFPSDLTEHGDPLVFAVTQERTAETEKKRHPAETQKRDSDQEEPEEGRHSLRADRRKEICESRDQAESPQQKSHRANMRMRRRMISCFFIVSGSINPRFSKAEMIQRFSTLSRKRRL